MVGRSVKLKVVLWTAGYAFLNTKFAAREDANRTVHETCLPSGHTLVSMNWHSVLYHAARQRQKVQEIQDVSATEPSSAQYPAMSLYNIKHVMLTLNGWYKFDSCADFIVLRSHSARTPANHLITMPSGGTMYVQ